MTGRQGAVEESCRVATFHHDDIGTSEAVWEKALSRSDIGCVTLQGVDHLIVVSAHPDDETLGAGGLIATARSEGIEVTVLLATRGEHSHLASPTYSPVALGERRVNELRQALRALAGPVGQVQLSLLDMPDGDVESHCAALAAAIVATASKVPGRILIVAPWAGDQHPDHEAAVWAATAAASRVDAQVLWYPIWMWHWGGPDVLNGLALVGLELTADAMARKREALQCHVSQTKPLSGQPGDEQLLSERFQTHFHRECELFIQPHSSELVDPVFDRIHQASCDPWDTVHSSYEREKCESVLAALRNRQYRNGLEVGCSVGEQLAALAPLCKNLLGIDASAEALAHARRRVSALPHVALAQARVPSDWPAGDFDLIVVSEIGYYLSPAALKAVIAKVAASLADDGVLVLCHWRHPIVGWPLRGSDVHDQFAAAFPAALRVSSTSTNDYLLDVYDRCAL